MRRNGTRFGRRGGSSRGSSTPPVVTTLYGISGFDTTNLLATAAGFGIRGAVSGFHVNYLARLDSIVAANQLLGNTLTGTTGWGVLNVTPGTSLVFRGGNGSTTADSPGATLGAGDVGKLHLISCYCTGSAVGIRFNAVDLGTTALAGFSASSAGTRETMGIFSTTLPATGWTICGRSGGLGIPTAPEWAAFEAATKAALQLVAIPGKTDQLINISNSAAPAVANPTVATTGDNMTVYAGSVAGLVLETITNPVLGW